MPKTFFSNTLLIFIARFFPSLANLLIIIIYSRYLPQAVYGNYTNFWIHLNIICPIACFGIHVLIVTYSAGHITRLAKEVSTKNYIFYCIWLLFLSAVFAVLQSGIWNPYHSISFFISFFFLLSYTLITILESVLVVYKSYKFLVIINLLYSLAFLAIHWFLLQASLPLERLFAYLLIVLLLKLFVYIVAIRAKIPSIQQSKQWEIIEYATTKSLWLHLGLYDVSQSLFAWVDKFIISIALTAGVSAIYYNGTLNIPFLPLLLNAAGSAVLIQLAAGRKNDETKDTIQLMNQSGRILSCIVFPLFFFLFIYRSELMMHILTKKYSDAVPVFAVSLLVLPLRAYSFTTVLQRFHKGALLNIVGLADLLTGCALMYPLYKLIGLPGVALGFVISTYLQAGFYLYFSARVLKVAILQILPYKNWLLKLILFGMLFFVIHYAGQLYVREIYSIILGCALLVFFVLISLWIETRNHH